MPLASVHARWFRFELVYFFLGTACLAFAAILLPESAREIEMIGGDWQFIALPPFMALIGSALWFAYFVDAGSRLDFDGAIVRYRSWRIDASVALREVTDISMYCRITRTMDGKLNMPQWRLRLWASESPVKETKSGSFWRRTTIFGETSMRPPDGAKLLLEAQLEPFWDREIADFVRALLSAKPPLRLDDGVRNRFGLN